MIPATMIKKAGYYIFAVFFTIFRLFPLKRDKVFFVATHDDSEEGNVGIVAEALKRTKPEVKQVFLTKRDGIRRPFSFFVGKAYHLATAGTIFMDNEFMPMAYITFSKQAKVVQLWHGTGSIKKFGLDVETGEVARLARKANRRITHLIVNSELTKKQYEGAFQVPERNIYILGLPRTDLILDTKKMKEKQEHFYVEYPELKGKRCVLYAPTFRDNETQHPRINLGFSQLLKAMDENDVLLLRLHPHVAANYSDVKLGAYGGRIRNMSYYSGVSTLLSVADCLITDYSSIVFEYCLLKKPMIFYAYDLEEFREKSRGFYPADYESYVPGPIARSQADLEKIWEEWRFDEKKLSDFNAQTFQYLDQNAVGRLLELIF